MSTSLVFGINMLTVSATRQETRKKFWISVKSVRMSRDPVAVTQILGS